MSDFRGLYTIRPMVSTDKGFIMATFLRGLYYGNSWYNMIPKHLFMPVYKFLIETMLQNPNCVVNVACFKDDPDTIIGYSILSKNNESIYWVYVKEKWRNKKIGTSLLPTDPKYAVHLTDSTKHLLSKYPNLVFNPFLMS